MLCVQVRINDRKKQYSNDNRLGALSLLLSLLLELMSIGADSQHCLLFSLSTDFQATLMYTCSLLQGKKIWFFKWKAVERSWIVFQRVNLSRSLCLSMNVSSSLSLNFCASTTVDNRIVFYVISFEWYHYSKVQSPLLFETLSFVHTHVQSFSWIVRCLSLFLLKIFQRQQSRNTNKRLQDDDAMLPSQCLITVSIDS